MSWQSTGGSQHRACQALVEDRSSVRYRSVRSNDAEARAAMKAVASERRRYGYNHHRPHTSLDGLTPWEYHQRSVVDQNLNRAN